MDISNIGIFKMAGEKMNWLAARQNILAQNVANSNTPSYLPREIEDFDFKGFLSEAKQGATPKVQMYVTNPMHLKGNEARIDSKYDVYTIKPNYETSLDGNGVIVEEEMAKMDETRSNYDLVASIYQKNISLINTALGVSN